MRNELIPGCPVRVVLSKVCDKWAMLVLYELEKGGVMRFGELQKAIPDISQKMLTITLKTLHGFNLISRKVYSTIPPKTEYQLTDTGKKLMPHIDMLIGWAKENQEVLTENKNLTEW